MKKKFLDSFFGSSQKMLALQCHEVYCLEKAFPTKFKAASSQLPNSSRASPWSRPTVHIHPRTSLRRQMKEVGNFLLQSLHLQKASSRKPNQTSSISNIFHPPSNYNKLPNLKSNATFHWWHLVYKGQRWVPFLSITVGVYFSPLVVPFRSKSWTPVSCVENYKVKKNDTPTVKLKK